MLGAHLPLLGIGMISMPAESATLDLSTPYIHIPKGIWDVLLLAANTKQQARDGEEALYVDCGALNVFPDLVVGVEQEGHGEEEAGEGGREDEEDDDDADEFIIRPERYVLQPTEGKCVLLVRNADSCHDDRGIIKLGWAAARRRDVVLDWGRARVGFKR
jgi:saccharopepsin